MNVSNFRVREESVQTLARMHSSPVSWSRPLNSLSLSFHIWVMGSCKAYEYPLSGPCLTLDEYQYYNYRVKDTGFHLIWTKELILKRKKKRNLFSTSVSCIKSWRTQAVTHRGSGCGATILSLYPCHWHYSILTKPQEQHPFVIFYLPFWGYEWKLLELGKWLKYFSPVMKICSYESS